MTLFQGTDDLVKRKLLLFAALIVLVVVYLIQKISYFHFFFGPSADFHNYIVFIFNKSIRLTLNDSACLLIIYCFFYKSKYVRLGGFIQAFETFIVLPIYFIVKLTLEGDSEISSPLLSQIHRLIVNPILMFLFITALLLQQNGILKRN